MKNTVVIKSNRSGMTVILDAETPFEQLLADLARKFGESARFWGAVKMTLTLSGRPLSPEEEMQIVNVISEYSQIEIICLLDENQERTDKCEKALNEKMMEALAAAGRFREGDVKAGENIESDTSVVVIGNVEPGAGIVSGGHVIVIGDLFGSVSAGTSGNFGAVAAAMDMAPSSLRIAGIEADCAGKSKRLAKGPALVRVENGRIAVKNMKKGLFRR